MISKKNLSVLGIFSVKLIPAFGLWFKEYNKNLLHNFQKHKFVPCIWEILSIEKNNDTKCFSYKLQDIQPNYTNKMNYTGEKSEKLF